jgi:hypothetical protein
MNHPSTTTPLHPPHGHTTRTREELRSALSPAPRSETEIPRLWRMSHSARVTAMWRGELTLAQLRTWSSRRPSEVPLLAGEFAWIIMRTPDWAEAAPAPGEATR